jgi:hypothetical protein
LERQVSFLLTQEVVLEVMEEMEVMATMDVVDKMVWMLQDIHAALKVVPAVLAATEGMLLVV